MPTIRQLAWVSGVSGGKGERWKRKRERAEGEELSSPPSPLPHQKSPLPYPLRKAWYSGYQTTWHPTSTTVDCRGISFFLSQCQQCVGSKPTNHERGLWYTNHWSITITIMVVQIVCLSKSTLLFDEDLQCAVKMSRSISKWQLLWDKR